MATTDRLMPLSTSARRKSDGTAYIPDDREAVSVIVDGYTQTQTRVPYFELSQNGGVRQFVHAAYPATVYRAKRDYSDGGKVALDMEEVRNDDERAQAARRGFCALPNLAHEALELAEQDVARAAAETAYKAQGMSEAARRSHHKKSADSPDHVTE